jgi:hypothetical protein
MGRVGDHEGDRPAMSTEAHEPRMIDGECPNCGEGCGGDHPPVQVCAVDEEDWPCLTAERDQLAARLAEVEAERDAVLQAAVDDIEQVREKALAQVEAWRPVVEAAIALRAVHALPVETTESAREVEYQIDEATSALAEAVDSLPSTGDTDG